MRRAKKPRSGRVLTASPLASSIFLRFLWVIELHAGASPPNFISDIFYLALATGHYGLQKTIQTFDDLGKEQDEVRRHLDNITVDNTWMGVSGLRDVRSLLLTSANRRHLCRRGLKPPLNK
jgi:hypothetical protein